MLEQKFIDMIARDTGLQADQVSVAIGLFDKGASISFAVRYRRDLTGNLGEDKLEAIAQANVDLNALTQRREAILDTIRKLDSPDEAVIQAIEACTDKKSLEDLYLPHRKQRRTSAAAAHEAGLAPLADFLWGGSEPDQSPGEFADTFINADKGVATREDALQGARHILTDRVFSDARVRKLVRERMVSEARITTTTTKLSDGKKTKYGAFYDYSESLRKLPSNKLLTLLHGVKEGMLRMELSVDDASIQEAVCGIYIGAPGSPDEATIRPIVEAAYTRLLRPFFEDEVIALARQHADVNAVKVFRENVRNAYLAPAGGRIPVVSVAAGNHAASTIAIVNGDGEVVSAASVPAPSSEEAKTALSALLLEVMQKHGVASLVIGNGVGSRDIANAATTALGALGNADAFYTFVSEQGATAYAGSAIGGEEFPERSAEERAAIFVARRYQDPLAELVKIEPRAAGVGQYQHDVNQKLLREGLHATIESCVNYVGVDLNRASVSSLRYICGIQYGTAQNIVAKRKESGRFSSLTELLDVDGVGPKVFEQCAGFLRIYDGANPLDATAIHPEAYSLVESIAEKAGVSVSELIGNGEALEKVDFSALESEIAGPLYRANLRSELASPAGDRRKKVVARLFSEHVRDPKDLALGADVEGIVTNVTDFGAFVDIGVSQDGLVHLSELANRFVRDPREVVQVGEVVKCRIIGLDVDPLRISLSRKALLAETARKPRRRKPAEAGAEASKRPDRTEREERPRQRPRRPSTPRDKAARPSRKPNGNERKRSQRPQKVQKVKSKDEQPLNTQLADQLAALKDKFGS